MQVQNVNFKGYTAGTKLREAFAQAEADTATKKDTSSTAGYTAGTKLREAFAQAEADTATKKRTRPSVQDKRTNVEKSLDNISLELNYMANLMKTYVDFKVGKQEPTYKKGSDRV